MADATATIEGRMRPQRERRVPAKFRDYEADVGFAALRRLKMHDHHKLPLIWRILNRSQSRRIIYTSAVSQLSRMGSTTETVEIRVNNCRRFLKEKPVDSYTKISSFTSDGVSREVIPVDQPNPHACIKSECAQRSRSGSHRRSKRISKANSTGSHRRSKRISNANSTDVESSEIIPVDQPNPHACIKSKCTQRSRSGSHRRSKRISKANSTDVESSEIIPVDQPNPHACIKSKCTQRSRSGSHRRSKRISKANSTESILPKRLTDALFDHYFRNMWSESSEERREMCTFLTCFWFEMYVVEHSKENVLRWIKNLNIFSKKYVFVPILLWSHWSLLIFCHLGESLDSKTITPCMLLLDSLQSHSSISELEPIIRRLVLEIFETEGRPESKDMVEKIPLLVPKVPQQKNFTDCGLFALYYINLFLECAPENLSISDGYSYFMTENWFTRKDLKRFYNKLEAFGLQIEEDEESFDSSDLNIEYLGTIPK